MAIRPVITILNDDDPMPFGKKYKGIPMEEVPASYLHWVWHEVKVGDVNLQSVRDYIFRNIEVLKEENDDLIWDEQ